VPNIVPDGDNIIPESIPVTEIFGEVFGILPCKIRLYTLIDNTSEHELIRGSFIGFPSDKTAQPWPITAFIRLFFMFFEQITDMFDFIGVHSFLLSNIIGFSIFGHLGSRIDDTRANLIYRWMKKCKEKFRMPLRDSIRWIEHQCGHRSPSSVRRAVPSPKRDAGRANAAPDPVDIRSDRMSDIYGRETLHRTIQPIHPDLAARSGRPERARRWPTADFRQTRDVTPVHPAADVASGCGQGTR